MWMIAAVLVSAAVASVFGQTVDYSVLCANHTMAIYQPIGPACTASTGTGPITSGVSEAQKALILTEQNNFRSLVANGGEARGFPGPQPNAADMKKLVWDDELAKVAQRWANQCEYGHDACRKVDRFYVGQNIFRILTSKYNPLVNWTRPTLAWYNEVTAFNPVNIKPFQFSSETAHYSALLWANTEFIGCGFTSYKSALVNETIVPYVRYFVCNYGQGGNYINETMYTVGTSCSGCAAGKVCENGLCA